MANPRGDQEYLGIDANVLVAYLDGGHPSHRKTTWLAGESMILNPTIAHETYHTLVFWAKWNPAEAEKAVWDACAGANNSFVNQTARTTKTGLELAVRHGLGGRDALILASLLVAKAREFRTLDKSLLALKRVSFGKSSLSIKPA